MYAFVSFSSILSSEIYTYKGKVDSSLIGILEKLADEKEKHMSGLA